MRKDYRGKHEAIWKQSKDKTTTSKLNCECTKFLMKHHEKDFNSIWKQQKKQL